MKSVSITICLLVAAFFLISCGAENTDTANEQAAQTESATHAEHTTATETDGLVLNDGKKWQMDDHTRASFAKMATSFATVDAATLDVAGLKLAGDALMDDLNGLIQGCTMSGPDHDQLHVYLMAYIPAVTALQEAGEVVDAVKVQHYLSIYGDFFE